MDETAAPLIVIAGANDVFIDGLNVTDNGYAKGPTTPLEVLNVLGSYGTSTFGAQLGTIVGWTAYYFGPSATLPTGEPEYQQVSAATMTRRRLAMTAVGCGTPASLRGA